jgi:hypothetical protein
MDFFRPEKRTEVAKPEENKDELTLNFNDFREPEVKKDLFALAQLVHNLCFIVPGTYPDTPEMGINIKQYQFEHLREQELRRIQQNIQEQVDTYIPTTQIAEVVCQMFVDPVTRLNNLGVGFAVATDPTATQNFFIFFTETNGTIVSNIIF